MYSFIWSTFVNNVLHVNKMSLFPNNNQHILPRTTMHISQRLTVVYVL